LGKLTNGQDADTAPGPYIPVGDAVEWTYVVTNTGNVELTGVTVSDDILGAITCPQSSLVPDEAMTCTASGGADPGQYQNQGMVTGTPPVGPDVSDSDTSHYFGADPAIDLEKHTNGQDADEAPGPYILAGEALIWTYTVTNTGNVTLTDVTVNDDVLGAIPCPKDELLPQEAMTCTFGGTASAGGYSNLGTASGTPPGGLADVSDEDPSHYYGVQAAVVLQKLTAGEDADTPPGPTLREGEVVTWTYAITNTGNVPLIDIQVEDDQGVSVTCPTDALEAGASLTCTGEGEVLLGQYKNLGQVQAYASAAGLWVSDQDASHYFGIVGEFEVFLAIVMRTQ
jgi:hypothetical protein